MSEPIRIISATRVSRDQFEATTHLGRSLALLRQFGEFETDIAFENTDGLPAIYNRAIERTKNRPAVLVFVHDDVFISDLVWTEEIRRCLQDIDIVGVAGNRRRVPKQPSWAFISFGQTGAQWDLPQNLSGVVCYGEPPGDVKVYGAPRQLCVLLDGLFLAVRSDTLHRTALQFDPRFRFDFYDLDFCRQAELKQLKMGTASLKVIHRSQGALGSSTWMAAYQSYLEKYGD